MPFVYMSICFISADQKEVCGDKVIVVVCSLPLQQWGQHQLSKDMAACYFWHSVGMRGTRLKVKGNEAVIFDSLAPQRPRNTRVQATE